MGCGVSDHGLEEIYAEDFTGSEIEVIFNKIHQGKGLNDVEQRKFKSAMLLHFAEWDWEKGWVQQFHLGALRNNNLRMMRTLGLILDGTQLVIFLKEKLIEVLR
jgi:glucuronate isomerase